MSAHCIAFAIFVPKIIKVGGNFTRQKQFCLFLGHFVQSSVVLCDFLLPCLSVKKFKHLQN